MTIRPVARPSSRSVACLLAPVACLLAAAAAMADFSNVRPNFKFAWGENVGWLNWRDSGAIPGDQGAFFGPEVLSGFIWGENIGYINLGDGSPDSGSQYSNTVVMGTLDFGVNRNPVTGRLSGFAWGENVGWINFDGGALATPPQPARIEFDGRLRGYAWGENIGWINLDLDEPGQFVSINCPPDFNDDGSLNDDDLGEFITAYFEIFSGPGNYAQPCPGADPPYDTNGFRADITQDCSLNDDDLGLFITLYFLGCG